MYEIRGVSETSIVTTRSGLVWFWQTFCALDRNLARKTCVCATCANNNVHFIERELRMSGQHFCTEGKLKSDPASSSVLHRMGGAWGCLCRFVWIPLLLVCSRERTNDVDRLQSGIPRITHNITCANTQAKKQASKEVAQADYQLAASKQIKKPSSSCWRKQVASSLARDVCSQLSINQSA